MNGWMRCVAATLALTVVAVGYVLVEGVPVRPGPPRPAAHAAIPRLQPLLTARLALDHGTELSLTTEQRDRLGALDREWQRTSAAPQAAATTEASQLAEFLRQQGTGKMNLQEIQRQSAEYRERSEELRALRTHHADAVAQVLTDTQRERMQHLTSSEGGSR